MRLRAYVVSAGGVLKARDIPDSFPLKKESLAVCDRLLSGGTMIALCRPDQGRFSGSCGRKRLLLQRLASAAMQAMGPASGSAATGAKRSRSPSSAYALGPLIRIKNEPLGGAAP